MPNDDSARFETMLQSENELWQALRECRKKLADENGVPPYVIFHDATLMAMIEQKPTTSAELLQVNGVGQRKLDKYGSDFLTVISRYS